MNGYRCGTFDALRMIAALVWLMVVVVVVVIGWLSEKMF